jgi:hypothetical protein
MGEGDRAPPIREEERGRGGGSVERVERPSTEDQLWAEALADDDEDRLYRSRGGGGGGSDLWRRAGEAGNSRIDSGWEEEDSMRNRGWNMASGEPGRNNVHGDGFFR